MPTLSLSLRLDDKESEKESKWEIEDLWGVCLCVFSTVPLLFVLFAYLFFLHIYSFYETIGPLSFCFASHLLRTNTRCVALWGCLSAFHIFCVLFYNILNEMNLKVGVLQGHNRLQDGNKKRQKERHIKVVPCLFTVPRNSGSKELMFYNSWYSGAWLINPTWEK